MESPRRYHRNRRHRTSVYDYIWLLYLVVQGITFIVTPALVVYMLYGFSQPSSVQPGRVGKEVISSNVPELSSSTPQAAGETKKTVSSMGDETITFLGNVFEVTTGRTALPRKPMPKNTLAAMHYQSSADSASVPEPMAERATLVNPEVTTAGVAVVKGDNLATIAEPKKSPITEPLKCPKSYNMTEGSISKRNAHTDEVDSAFSTSWPSDEYLTFLVNSVHHSCFQDDLCYGFQDCCFQSDFMCPSIPRRTVTLPQSVIEDLRCINLDVFRMTGLVRGIDSCPDYSYDQNGAAAVEFCTNALSYHDDDQILRPVFHVETGIVFRNIFCAICYGLNMANIQPVPLSIHCSESNKDVKNMIRSIRQFRASDTCYTLIDQGTRIRECLPDVIHNQANTGKNDHVIKLQNYCKMTQCEREVVEELVTATKDPDWPCNLLNVTFPSVVVLHPKEKEFCYNSLSQEGSQGLTLCSRNYFSPKEHFQVQLHYDVDRVRYLLEGKSTPCQEDHVYDQNLDVCLPLACPRFHQPMLHRCINAFDSYTRFPHLVTEAYAVNAKVPPTPSFIGQCLSEDGHFTAFLKPKGLFHSTCYMDKEPPMGFYLLNPHRLVRGSVNVSKQLNIRYSSLMHTQGTFGSLKESFSQFVPYVPLFKDQMLAKQMIWIDGTLTHVMIESFGHFPPFVISKYTDIDCASISVPLEALEFFGIAIHGRRGRQYLFNARTNTLISPLNFTIRDEVAFICESDYLAIKCQGSTLGPMALVFLPVVILIFLQCVLHF